MTIFVNLVLFALLWLSCTATAPIRLYKIGDLEIRIYTDRETMLLDMPVRGTLYNSAIEPLGQIVVGFYDREKKRIYSVDRVDVLIHELRHHLQPEWRHPPNSSDVPFHFPR